MGLGSMLKTRVTVPFLTPPGQTLGTGGPSRALICMLGLLGPSLHCLPLVPGHRFPFHVRRKLCACLQKQLGLVLSAVAPCLPSAAQSRLCLGGPWADGSALARTQELQGVLGCVKLGPLWCRFLWDLLLSLRLSRRVDAVRMEVLG